jgi:2,4-dienoyl-CoA reductase-like NADH-dependent reductase (Old Yellow Enzyme family)
MKSETLTSLFAPFLFNNGQVVKNRMMLAPMTNWQSQPDGTLGDAEYNWLRMRAEGGFGTIITAGSATSANAIAYPGQLAAYSDRHILGLRRLSEMTKENGALSIVQLMPPGMRAPAELNSGAQPAAPSVVHFSFPNFEVPRELTDAEILQIKKDVVESVVRAVESGVSGIELHGANGYLFTQFLSKTTNKRTDRWGGSNENRARLLLETLQEAKARVPKDFIIGVRLLAEDSPAQRGFDIDETLEVIRWMNGIDYTYLHLSAGQTLATSWKYPEESKTNLARVREVLRADIALVASGGIVSANDAVQALREGADFVAIAKAAIVTPDWPKRIVEPGFKIPSFPRTVAQLAEVGVTSPFISFLNSMKGGVVAKELAHEESAG